MPRTPLSSRTIHSARRSRARRNPNNNAANRARSINARQSERNPNNNAVEALQRRFRAIRTVRNSSATIERNPDNNAANFEALQRRFRAIRIQE